MSDGPLFERPLDELLPATHRAAPRPARSAPTAGPETVRDRPDVELVAIARYQKWLIRVILLQILIAAGWVTAAILTDQMDGPSAPPIVVFGIVAAVILSLVALGVMIALASMLYSRTTAVALGLCQFLVGGGTILLCVVNVRATAELRRNGIRVGLLGARRSDLTALVTPQRDKDQVQKLGW
ncbi:hypothetical protein VT84_14470 [Gemmata sp. SH-PL17]|uniref:hypothetical protein n=1 Tax=Gemmata sp. SH-PL17 TaxID=1630693 RepID=UPI0004ACB78C|nr:hypothetical protein [Gemmata sp. SH-PL17]AMV25598.1 hypothetical protein VT84_14470 [Gemmata sp. SH-PL17]